MTPNRLTALLAVATSSSLLASPALGTANRPSRPVRTSSVAGVSAGPVPGSYAWPVHGPVIRGFEPPLQPMGPGHRGIDVAAPVGTVLHAANGGVVAFAGWVGGALYISIDHPDGVRTTYSWLSRIDVVKGKPVLRGEAIGLTGQGHPGSSRPHLHLGARIGSDYIDPLPLLEPAEVADLIHLAPLEPGGSGTTWGWAADRPRGPPGTSRPLEWAA